MHNYENKSSLTILKQIYYIANMELRYEDLSYLKYH